MITMEVLKAFGADTSEGLDRCLGNEEFYLKMVDMGIKDDKFDALGKALDAGNLDLSLLMLSRAYSVILRSHPYMILQAR